MGRNILVVEDDKNISDLIHMYLVKEGFDVRIAGDGGKALEEFQKKEPDLILLDIMLPVMDGWAVCAKIRETSKVPIIMLTAKSEDADKLMGFECGADDYLTKPFNILELKARIRALLRRAGTAKKQTPEQTLVCGHITLDRSSRSAFREDVPVDLTAKEFDLLELMALDFAIDELGLYLTTHADDQQALELYWSYIRLGQEGRKRYQEKCGPLMQTDITPGSYQWLNDPWPWDGKGN